MNIRGKLLIAFTVTTLLTITVGGIGYLAISRCVGMIDNIILEDTPYLKSAQDLKIMALQHRRYEKDFFLNIGNAEKQNKYLEKFEADSEKTKIELKSLLEHASGESRLSEEVEKAIIEAQSAYSQYHSQFIELSKAVQGDSSVTPQQANKMMTPFKEHIYKFEESVDIIVASGIDLLKNVASESKQFGRKTISFIVLIIIAGGLISVALGLIVTKIITGPIATVVRLMEKISTGDFSDTLDTNRKDEMGRIISAMNLMVSSLRDMFKDILASATTLNSSSNDLAAISQQMSAGSEQTSAKSNSVAIAAEEMSTNINTVAAAAEEAATNVNLVATASEEMTATINEITQNTEKGRTITHEAVSEAKKASERIDELGKAAMDIEKVTEAITEISEQTNLLALNATIEAARAGEAGKGFAVVANEIKELARQTAEATSEIKNRIDGIQSSTKGTVTQVEQITKVINDVNEIVTTIATAVEEQSIASRDITSNIAQAAQGIQEVTENVNQSSSVSGDIAQDVADVNQAAGEMSTSSSHVNTSANELSKLSELLSVMVNRFKV